MAFYENTIVAKQDLSEKEILSLKEKYNKIITNSSGKMLKVENWGLLNLSSKIKSYNKGLYLHFKFECEKETLNEFHKNLKLDNSIIRHLTVKYKKLDTEKDYFKNK